MNKDAFFDENALLHAYRGEYSENGPLFTAEYTMAQTIYNREKMACTRALYAMTCKGFFDPNPADNNGPDVHFSHDNMTGIYTLHVLSDIDTRHLPVSYWNHKVWAHPRDMAFYSLCKTRKYNFLLPILLFPILLIAAIMSCMTSYYRTSGKMLWWLRCHTLKWHKNFMVRTVGHLLWLVCSVILKHKYGDVPMIQISSIYFKDKSHPIRTIFERIYYE